MNEQSNIVPKRQRAWQCPKPGSGQMQLVEVAMPQPGPGELLVRVDHAALNFSDLLMIEGQYQVRPPWPFTPGQELAGFVVAVGAGCRCRPGQRIVSKVTWGGFAEYATVPEAMAITVPDAILLTQALALPIAYLTAWFALHPCGKLQPHHRVLVLGASGGVGLAAVELAKAAGADVVAAAGSQDKLAIAREHGADYGLDYRQQDWDRKLRERAEGRGITHVIDPVGGAMSLEALRCMDWDAQLLVVGFASGEIPKIPGHRLLLKRLRAVGVYWNHERDASVIARGVAELLENLQTGKIRPRMRAMGSLEQLPTALRAIQNRRTVGKVYINPQETHHG